MFYAKVIGKTYSNFKYPTLEGIEIKIIQELNMETKEPTGKPLFALDAIGVGLGEFVAYEVSTEAAHPFEPEMVPSDATIVAIIDKTDIEGSP